MDDDLVNLERWVESAPEGQLDFRQAVHLILAAITNDLDLQKTMVMKGGLLMAIRYHSSRFTRDLDFSSSLTRADINIEELIKKLEASLATVVANSDYDLDCRIQSWRINPPSENATFPNVEMSIGYAYKGKAKHRHLLRGQCPTTINIDFNLNEPILAIEDLNLGDDARILAYMFTDLIAEKFRSLLQQEVRNRYRRQDTFDLRLLIERGVDEVDRSRILHSLREKARSRNIEPTRDSLANPELRRRAAKDYQTLADEVIGPLPDFDESFNVVELFYRSLPWDT